MRIANIKFILLLLPLFLFVSLLEASETRQATMGNAGIFLRDDANIFIFPATLMQYQDMAVAEMRARKNNQQYSIGIHMGYENNMASALYINQPIKTAFFPSGVFSGLNISLTNTYALFFATKLVGFDVGAGFLGAGSNYESGSGTTKDEQSASYVALILGLSNKQMDVGVTLELPGLTQKFGGNKFIDYSGFGIDAKGRFWMMNRKKTDIFPVARVVIGSASEDVSKTDYSDLILAGGIGTSRQINDDNLLMVGIEVSYSSLNEKPNGGTETTSTVLTLPGIYVGIESRISGWLTGRVGVSQVNQRFKEENKPTGGPTSETTSNGSQFKMALGLGMNFGNFLLDFAFNEGLLFDGPAILSNTNEVLANRLSITYNFGGGENE